MTKAVPVTVLTGFLGSGKTTLLNRLLRAPDMHGTAVVINEFGSVGLDHDLVDHTQENMVLLANGCICCTIRGDLVDAFERLAATPAAQSGELRHVVLETTGLADPAPILHTLMGDPRMHGAWRLAGVACTVDAFNGMATLDRYREAVKQAAVADRLGDAFSQACQLVLHGKGRVVAFATVGDGLSAVTRTLELLPDVVFFDIARKASGLPFRAQLGSRCAGTLGAALAASLAAAPATIVYPQDDFRALRTKEVQGKWVWQVKEIRVK